MADRFTRFKQLRALWGSARSRLAALAGPHEREGRLRAHRWQQILVAERELRDGIVRDTGDPDNAGRPQDVARADQQARAWYAQRDASRQWYDAQHRQAQQRRGR